VKASFETILNQNITLVYDALELDNVDRNALRGLVETSVKPMIMDTPEMIVAVFPQGPVIIQVGDRRLRVNYQRHDETLGAIPLWEIAAEGHRMLKSDSAPELIAYGFNYDIGYSFQDVEAASALVNLFLSESQVQLWETATSGEILSTTPKLKFRRDTTVYDLVLQPLQAERMKVHLNAHFETSGITLPESETLGGSFREEYSYLQSILSELLDGKES
jgi:hypothetical protein